LGSLSKKKKRETMRNKRKGKDWDRDMHGIPRNRAKTWGTKDRDPKKIRREGKRELFHGLTGSDKD
jgi:hypothetical protein